MRASALALASLIATNVASATIAQEAEELRRITHELLRDGHNRIGYSATYDALADLYEDPAAADNVLLFYSGRSQDKDLRVNADGRDGWNREHLWPQSHGTRSEPMKSDLHHLKPTDASINANRGSLDFDEGGRPRAKRRTPSSMAPASIRETRCRATSPGRSSIWTSATRGRTASPT